MAIEDRILALMAKTVEQGCTEEEALGAAEKVQELLHKYQINLSDLEIKSSKCETVEYPASMKSHPMVHYCLTAIALFTDTRVWFDRDYNQYIVYKFFGLEHDVLIAEYVLKICDWAIINGGEDFKKTDVWTGTPYVRGNLKKDFQYGMASRLASRIRGMKKKQVVVSSGRDLIVVKDAVVEEEWQKLDITLNSGKRMSSRNVDGGAYNMGKDAADRVPLNPGVDRDNRGELE